MFNTELEKIYDEKTVSELRSWAAVMESRGKHVRVAEPATEVPGMVFPTIVGIENFDDVDTEELDSIYERITKGRPFIEEDSEYMFPVNYKQAIQFCGGDELWVK